MLKLDALIEQRILEAIGRGELDDLPGAGRPLELDDDRFVPAESRLAYRVLKNAGYVPPEVDALRQIGDLRQLLEAAADTATRDAARARLSLLSTYLEARGAGFSALGEERYGMRVYAKLQRGRT